MQSDETLAQKLALKYLPPNVVLRRKQGFELPLQEWLREPWRKAVRRLILSDRAIGRGYFRRDYVDHVLQLHEKGSDHRHRVDPPLAGALAPDARRQGSEAERQAAAQLMVCKIERPFSNAKKPR